MKCMYTPQIRDKMQVNPLRRDKWQVISVGVFSMHPFPMAIDRVRERVQMSNRPIDLDIKCNVARIRAKIAPKIKYNILCISTVGKASLAASKR